MDNYSKEYKRKYWKEIYEQAKSDLRKEFGIKGDAVKLAWNFGLASFAVVLVAAFFGISLVAHYMNLQSNSIIEVVLYITGTLFIADLLGLVFNNYVAIPLTAYFSKRFDVAAKRDFDKQNLIDSLSSKNLKLSIDYGDIVYSGLGTPPLTIYLPLNVVNDEKQEIVDLECILQVAESRTEDQTSVWSRISYKEEKVRMAWEDGEYRTELKPGNHEMKKLKIATLDCSKNEFRIAHENNKVAFPYYQVNTRYRLDILLNGHLKGSFDYQSFSRVVDFVCLPSERVLEFSEKISRSPRLPKAFKQVFEQ